MLEERKCVTVGVGFEGYTQAMPKGTVHFLLPMDPDVEFSALLQHHVCLQATMSHHDDNELNL